MILFLQKKIPLARFCLLLLLSLGIPLQAQYYQQNYTVTNGKADTALVNSKFKTTVSLGQYVVVGAMSDNTRSSTTGILAFYLLPPQAPVVTASQGDYPDRVEINWKFDVLSPPANLNSFLVYRDKTLIATLPIDQPFYKDYNVLPGNYYSYSVTGVNNYGTGPAGTGVGFVNPNGTMTGTITTQQGVPVNDVQVLLSPNLGNSLKFNGISNYVDCGSNLKLKDSSFTIEFWLKQDAPDNGYVAGLNLHGSASADSQLAISFANGKMFVQMNALVTTITPAHGNPWNNSWNHFAWTYNKASGLNTIYVDSVKVTSFTSPAFKGSGKFILGKGYSDSDFLAMYLDEVRVFSFAKDSASMVRDMGRTVSSGSAGMLAYWKMDEGKGTSVFDYATKKNTGTINGPVNFSTDKAPILQTAFTGTDGSFVADGINYGTSTNFTVTPTLTGRIFTPASRVLTLSASNTAVNNVNFTDISQIPVSGYVTDNGTACLNDTTVEILVDDSSWAPKVMTTMAGYYVVDLPPGSTHKLTPKRTGYSFSPAFFHIDSISKPLANVNFSQTVKYNLNLTVGGGTCSRILNGITTVTLASIPSCAVIAPLVQSGTTAFYFPNLPPMRYSITVTNTIAGVTFAADTVDLSNGSRSKSFIYRSPLLVAVDQSALPTAGNCTPPQIVLSQLQKYKVKYIGYELYNTSDTCHVDSVTFNAVNGISDITAPDTVYGAGGVAADSFYAGYPNILSSGPHPYQKQLLVTATDRNGRTAQATLWAIVTGIKPRQGQTFVSRSPEIPLMILRDPPGDQSFSYITKSSTVYNNLALSVSNGKSSSVNYNISLAPSFTAEAGIGFLVGTEIVPIAQVTGSVSVSHNNTTTNQLQTTMTATEQIATADFGQISGHLGDVFIGVAYNVIYGLTDSIGYNSQTCSVTSKTGVIMAPDSIRTKFVYTEDYILNTQIPNLYLLHTSRDSLYAQNWQRFIDYNDSLKASSTDSVYNISFSAGSNYTVSKSFQRDATFSVYDELPIVSEVDAAGGIFVDGAGAQVGTNLIFSYNIGTQTDQTRTSFNEVGYTLSDGDPGDGFTVNIANDKVYGTPVFRTVAGQSSCPYEAGTLPRDQAQFSPKSLSAVNVNPDSIAYWPIYLGNASATNETRDYTLRVLNSSNPDGATIAVNGIIIESGITYTLPYGQIQTMLMVRRGPASYSYDSLTLVLSPACGDDQQSDTLLVSVRFLRPCSPVVLTQPFPNWLINKASNDTMIVSVSGYDKTNTAFQSIQLQYRLSVNGANGPFNGFARKFDAKLDGDRIIPHYDLTHYPIVPFPVTKAAKYVWHFRKDYYDAAKENRYYLLNDFAAIKTRLGGFLPVGIGSTQKSVNAVADADYSPVMVNPLIRKKPGIKAADADQVQNTVNPGIKPKPFVSKRIADNDQKNAPNAWFTIKTISRDSLLDGATTLPWVSSGLDDGQYDLRAVTVCNGGISGGTSAIISGVIDKNGPLVMGTPQPSTGVLTTNNQISVTFNKQIQTTGLTTINNIQLFYASGPQSGQPIDINFSTDGKSIIIIPNIADRFLESSILTAIVKHVSDVHGNAMRVPLGSGYIDSLSWQFVVHKSPVQWDINQITLEKYGDATVQVTRNLVNAAGFQQPFNLTGIPSQVVASPISGTVPGLGNVPITFSFTNNIPAGSFDKIFTNSTIYGNVPLQVHVQVDCRSPQWSITPSDYQYSMNIVGNLYIDNALSNDVNDKIAAFVGNETRGVANIQKFSPTIYRVFLTIYSNHPSGEQLQFRVWDSSACNEYAQIAESFTFSADRVIGTVSSPQSLTATSSKYQLFKFNSGWSWLSFNTKAADMSINAVLKNLTPAVGDLIKSQSPYAQFSGSSGWVGSLDTLKLTTMYMLNLAKTDSLGWTGVPALEAATPIILQSGWNYLGFIPQMYMNLNTALTSLKKDSDNLIKGQYSFAMYDSALGWIGSLAYLSPLQGYKIKLSRSDTLIYPPAPLSTAPEIVHPIASAVKTIEEHAEWTVDANKYQYSMSVIAELGDGIVDSVNAATVLGVFNNNECLGFTTLLNNNCISKKLFFLTVYGNRLTGDSLQFRILDPKTDKVFGITSGVRFQADAVYGSLDKPLHLTGTPLEVRNGTLIPKTFALLQNYPNPFNPTTRIDYAVPKDGNIEVIIYNIMGEKIRTLVNENKHAGFYSSTWDGKNDHSQTVPSGVYLYRMISGTFSSTRKLTLLK